MRSFISISALALLAACAGAPQTVTIPDAIKGADSETLVMIVPARGVQIYECRASAAAPSRYDWAFTGPEAELFDTRGTKIGKHYSGPTWEAHDGSRITGAVKARADAPMNGAPMAKDIPWLLLSATQTGAATGMFSRITSVQRVNTMGGVAPADGCLQATAGTVLRMPYTADYYFLGRR